jgi:phosphoglycerol transferase MdoB-like AlkP superfamily enzyme
MRVAAAFRQVRSGKEGSDMPEGHNTDNAGNIGIRNTENDSVKRSNPFRKPAPELIRLIRVIFGVVCIAALLVTTVLSWPSFFDIKKEGISGDVDYLPYRLSEGDQIRQVFELRSEGLQSFSLSFDLSEGWESSENGLVLIEILREGQSEPLRTYELSGADLNRFTQTEFELSPGKTSAGDEYTLVLTVVRIPDGQNISIHTQNSQLWPMQYNQREIGLALTVMLTYSVFDWPAFWLVLFLSLMFMILVFVPMKWLGRFFNKYPVVPLAIAPLLLLIIIELFNTLNQTFIMNASVFWLTYLILLLTELAFAGILGGCRRGIYLNLVLFSSLAISNHVKLFFRGDPFFAGDLRVLTEAAQAVNDLKFIIGNRFLLGWLIILIYLVLFAVLEQKKRSKAWRAVISIAPLIIFVFYMNFLIMNPDRMDKIFSVPRYPWNNMMNSKYNGFTIPFFQSVHHLVIKTPDDNYQVSDSFYQLPDSAITEAASPENPHVIVIMSESYADFNNISELETSEPVMPFYDSLQRSGNTINGNLLVSVFGGGTCNTEFEYLTGSSMLFMNDGITPYTSYFERKTHSLPELFSLQGYDTLAVHPYYRTFWDRHKVYPNIGFDRFIALEDFPEGGEVRQFVGDQAAFEQIRQALEQSSPEERKFIFTVTMQNHFPYYGEEEILAGLNYNIKLPGMVDVESVELYLSILRESDEALRGLVGYLETVNEPVLLVFFGDHLPGNNNVFNTFYQSLFSKPMTDLGPAETQKMYETPYLIWANYDLPELDKPLLSPNFLATETIKLAGIETTPYFEMVAELQRDIKAMSNKLIILQNDRRVNREQIPSSISKPLDRYWQYEYDNIIASKEEFQNG